MNVWGKGLVMLAVLGSAQAALAGKRLAFEYFPQRHFSLSSQWQTPQFTGEVRTDARAVASLREVELRLAIPAKFRSEQVQIFLLLPAQIPGLRGTGGLTLTWSTRGILQAGTVHPGQRALIFQGVVDTPILTDFINFTFSIDAREMIGSLRVEPVYEIERR